MTTYSLTFINDYIEKNLHIKNSISPDISTIIGEITAVVSSPSYNKFPDFANKKIYRNLEYMKRKQCQKNELDKILDILRVSLNKLTDKTYYKLTGDIDDSIQKIIDLKKREKDEEIDNEDEKGYKKGINEKREKDYDDINNIIFSTFFVSKFNSKLYCRLYIDKLQKYDFIENQLFKYVETDLPLLYEKIELCNSVKFDEIDRVNKINDKLKAKLIFFCNCANNEIINIMCIWETVLKYISQLWDNIAREKNKPYCEEIAELICIALTIAYEQKHIIEDDQIYNEIQKFINFNNNDHKNDHKNDHNSDKSHNLSISLSNKIIIKFKNLSDNIYKDREKLIYDKEYEEEEIGDD